MIKEPIRVELDLTQREYVLLCGALDDSIDYYEDMADRAKDREHKLQEEGYKKDIERLRSLLRMIKGE